MINADRNSLIAKIHCAKRDLGLDDACYRQALATATRGCRSLKGMNLGQLMAVLEWFKDKGWKGGPAKKAQRRVLDDRPMARKIRAIWIEMGKEGRIRDRSERGLAHWVKRMVDKEDLRFCTEQELWMLVEAIKKWDGRTEQAIETTEINGIPVTKIVEKSK
jgi:phage gp16-like protein